MKNVLLKQALENYKKNKLPSWINGLFTGLIIAAVLSLGFINPFLMFIAIPLLVLPIIFSATMVHFGYKFNAPMTAGNSFKFFVLYFQHPFSGSFRFFFNLLRSVIAFFAVAWTCSFVAEIVVNSVYPDFMDQILGLYETMMDATALETFDIMAFFDQPSMKLFILISFVPAILIAVFVFTYFASRDSISIYYRASCARSHSNGATYIYKTVLSKKRRGMRKDYNSLNWPLFVLIGVGLIGGFITSYILLNDLMIALVIALVSGALLGSFFLPFYFSNMEVIYSKYEQDFKQGYSDLTQRLIKEMQNSIMMADEEKAELERKLKEFAEGKKEENDDSE